MKRHTTVDDYLKHASHWKTELEKLRTILCSTDLHETVKWGAPCYTHNGKNIVMFGGFKHYAALWFYQGALLTDPEKVLVNAQDGKTKALRQWRFTSAKDIKVRLVKAYVAEAISIEESGIAIRPDRAKPVLVPPELEAELKKNKRTRAAFDALSKGKQREYAEHIAHAKRDETKQSRLTKIVPMIVAGAGLHDKYRGC